MILATHAVAGTAVALVFKSSPVLAFFAAFASHFLLDAMPHLDHPIKSLERKSESSKEDTLRGRILFSDPKFLKDFFHIGLDGLIGTVLAFYAAWPESGETAFIVALGVLGGVLPDFLQLVYYMFKKGPIVYLQRFHVWIHAKFQITDRTFLVIATQAPFVILFGVLIVMLQ